MKSPQTFLWIQRRQIVMQAIAFLPIACYITSTNNCLFSRRLLKKPRRIIIILLLLYQGYIVYFIDELSSFFSIFFLFLLLPFYCPPVSLLFFSCCCFVQLFCFLLLPYAILLVYSVEWVGGVFNSLCILFYVFLFDRIKSQSNLCFISIKLE